MTQTQDKNSHTMNFAVKWLNGGVFLYEIDNETGEDHKTILKKLWKQQNVGGGEMEIKTGLILEEKSPCSAGSEPIKISADPEDKYIEFESASMVGRFNPRRVTGYKMKYNDIFDVMEYAVNLNDGSIIRINEDTFEELKKYL